MKRKVIRIDEEKCNGCGLCAEACAEGAIQIIDGKAKLVSEIYCDGLGACIGECPQDAITIEEREAPEFDPKAVEKHLKKLGRKSAKAHHPEPESPRVSAPSPGLACGCPGSAVRSIERGSAESESHHPGVELCSELGNWPIQIKLLPVQAPYLQGAKLLIAADCTPFAFADFHRRFIKDRVVLIGCPKLDDAAFYLEKLTELFRCNDIKGVEVAYMEVPCCYGLVRIVSGAIEESGKSIPLKLTRIGIRGEIQEEEEISFKESGVCR